MIDERPKNQSKSKILIVDDHIANIDLLTELLKPYYAIMIARDGKEAVECCLKKRKPDLILLDVMMPGMDGYEVCEKIKEHAETKYIPIIFVTARNNEDDEVKGFKAGGVDFIPKPVNQSTLLARVSTHIELSRLRNEAARRGEELEKYVDQRTEQLRQANALLKEEIEKHAQTTRVLRDNEIMALRTSHFAALGSIAAGMAHQINNPNSFIKLNVPILTEIFNGFIKQCSGNDDDFRIGSLSQEKIREMVPKLLNGIQEGSSRIEYIVNHLSNFSKQELYDQKEATEINCVVEDALMMLANEVKKKSINVQKNMGKAPVILINRYQIEQVFMNILQNAIESLRDGHRTIWITTCLDKKLENISVEIRDNGCGMDAGLSSRIFEPFFTTKISLGGKGMGLTVSKQIMARHGGIIEFTSQVNKGTAFTLMFPLNETKKKCEWAGD